MIAISIFNSNDSIRVCLYFVEFVYSSYVFIFVRMYVYVCAPICACMRIYAYVLRGVIIWRALFCTYIVCVCVRASVAVSA